MNRGEITSSINSSITTFPNAPAHPHPPPPRMLFYQSLQTTSWLECSSCLSKFPEVTGHSTRRLFRGQKMQSETSIRMSRGTGLLRVATQKRSRPFLKTFATVFPPRGGGGCHSPEVFPIFFPRR